jgi:hypothetical protein
VACLKAAITTANTNGQANTIILEEGISLLVTVDNQTEGSPNGLPPIISPLTIRGVNADMTIIKRGSSALPFRIVHVAPTGILTLSQLALRGRFAPGYETIAQGGGMRNNGTLTILDSIISDNNAQYFGGISSVGTLRIDHSILSDNSAGPSSVDLSDGIASSGLLIITHSTITRNGATPDEGVTAYGEAFAPTAR